MIYGLSTKPIEEEKDTSSNQPTKVPIEENEKTKIDEEAPKVVDEEAEKKSENVPQKIVLGSPPHIITIEDFLDDEDQ